MGGAPLLGVVHRATVELEPAIVVVGGRDQKRIPRRRDDELLVAPMLGEPAREPGMVGLGHERQLTVATSHQQRSVLHGRSVSAAIDSSSHLR